MIIRVSCTSYLPPRNPAWAVLEKENELTFGEFGDWPQVLTAQGDANNLFWAIFLEDLFPKELLFKTGEGDFEKVKSIMDAVFETLELRLQQSLDNYTFIAWLGWQSDSIIRSSRQKTIITYTARYFEEKLYDFCKIYKRLFLIPLDIIFGEEGVKKCVDNRNFFLGRIRISQFGLNLLGFSLNTVIQRIAKPTSKLLVLDCDNTLWGGVIGENGLGGILVGQDGIGSAFSAFQFVVKQLSQNGLLLAISSKNEEKDVWSVFENHKSMVLTKSDIISYKIDWRDKSIHLSEIANELGLGLDSIVFWDDNPIERAKIKQSLPEVIVIEPSLEVVEWADLLKSLPYFASFVNSTDDLNKLNQYKSKAAFEKETKQFRNYNDFLRGINMQPQIVSIDESTIGRAVQLCQKTNQMNLRLIRHDEVSLNKIANSSRSVSFLVHLRDKFGDHGLIALIIVRCTKDDSIAFLDTFLMSCRVLGRNIEGWIFNKIKQKLQKKGYKKLEAEYVHGDRNSPASNILVDYGFAYKNSSLANPEKIKQYDIDLNLWEIDKLDIFD